MTTNEAKTYKRKGTFPRRWFFDEKEAIRLYLEEHLSVPKVAERLGVSKGVLYLLIQREQVSRKTNRRPGYEPANKVGRFTHSSGYVYVLVGLDHPMANGYGYALEHRLVMAEKLGRQLTAGEVVHHINGIRADNSVQNLELFGSHGEHMRHHMEGGEARRRGLQTKKSLAYLRRQEAGQ